MLSSKFIKYKVIAAEMLNTYDVCIQNKLIISEETFVRIDKQFKGNRNGRYCYQNDFN